MRQWDSNGNLIDAFTLTGSNVADAQTLWTPGMLYNGATNDKPRGNTQGTLLASAARTATVSSPNQTNYNAKGVIVFVNITVAGTGGLTPLFRATQPSAPGADIALNATGTPLTAIGKYAYVLYPGATASGNNVAQSTALPLPRAWYMGITHADSSSWTYSVDYALIL